MDTDVESQVDTAVEDSPVESQVEQQSYEPASESAPTPEPQAQSPATPWDAFKRLPEFQGADDRAIAARLYNAMEREKAASRALAQYQQVLPYAQEWIANRRDIEEFRQWKQQQVQPQHPQVQQAQKLAPQQAEQSKWWNPPKVRDSYRRYLVKDEDGREVISQDAPLDAKHELYEYQQYKADFAKKFLEDPEGALGPMVQGLAAKQAQEIVQQTFEQRENESYVTNVESENRDWLFDQETGNVTPEGLLVHKYVEEARERGINGPQQRWQYAIAMTERDMLARLFDDAQAAQAMPVQASPAPVQAAAPQPAPPPAPPARQPDLAQQNMQYLRREAARNPSRSAGAAVNDSRAPRPKRTFEELLREDASSRGLI
jgi:hypothetical protein